MSWRESSQILRVQIEPMRLKIRRRGKLSMLDLGLLRNWALLFVYTGPFQTRAALHSFLIFLEAVKVDFFFSPYQHLKAFDFNRSYCCYYSEYEWRVKHVTLSERKLRFHCKKILSSFSLDCLFLASYTTSFKPRDWIGGRNREIRLAKSWQIIC